MTQTASPSALPSQCKRARFDVRIFAFDAWLSGAIGLLLALAAEKLHELSGGGLEPSTLRTIGLCLLPWSVHNALTAREKPLRTISFAIQATGDALWALASVIVYARHFESLTTFGHLFYGPQIATVLQVLALKVCAFRRRAT